MNKEDAKLLAERIKKEAPEYKIKALLDFGGGDCALEVEEPQGGEAFTVFDERDWFVRMAKKEMGKQAGRGR